MSEREFEGKDFNVDKVKLYEPARQKMAKIYLHESSSFGLPNLQIYLFMKRDHNSLDETELEEKTIEYTIERYIKTKLKRDKAIFKKKSKKSAKMFVRQYSVEDI